MQTREQKIHKKIKIYCMTGVLCFGTCSTLTALYLDELKFNYALFQTLLMFIGESLCIIPALLQKYSTKRLSLRKISAKSEDSKTFFLSRFGKKSFCISGICDFVDSYLEYASFDLLPSPALMAFKMILMLNVFAFRTVILRRKIYRHQVLGLFLLIVGMILAGIVVIFNKNSSEKMDSNVIIGIIMMLAAQIFNMMGILSMEHLMWNIDIKPAEVVSIKSITGILCCIISYLPLLLIYGDRANRSTIADPIAYVSNHLIIIPWLIGFVGLTGIINFLFVKTLKVTDSLAYCTIDAGRMITFWAFSFAIIPKSANPFEVSGACLLAVGLLLYNEILIIPFFGFDKAVKKNLKENQYYKQLKEDNRAWQTGLDILMLTHSF